MKSLVVIGAGGQGAETLCLAEQCATPYRPIGFLDDSESLRNAYVLDMPVLGRVSDWTEFSDAEFIVAIGSPRVRQRIVTSMVAMGSPKFATLIHTSVLRSRLVSIGYGTMVCAGCVLTTRINIGQHCIINTNATLAHDVEVGDFCTVGPMVAAAGGVRLHNGVDVGASAGLRPGITVGRGSQIGLGAAVVSDIPDRSLAFGVPARVVRSLPEFTN